MKARPRFRGRWPVMVLALLLILLLPETASPASWWFHGVRSKEVTVCFAGNAVSTRLDRVRQIVTHLQEFEYAANVRFKSLAGRSLSYETGPLGNVNNLACPAPTQQPNGNSFYAGDVRVALWSTNVPVDPPGMVPGVGCTQPRVGSSWSNPPDELAAKRACQYNLKLGDDDLNMITGVHTGTPWLNHTLHEFGHALGFSHEHARADENANCVPAAHDEYHIQITGYLTPYDKNSVTHYIFPPSQTPSCQQTGSNYSNAGLTGYDKLALHILYPEDARVAEFLGTTVIQVGETLRLQSAWKARGANMGFVASNHVWKLNGVTRSNSANLALGGLGAGTYTLQYNHSDFLGRSYSYTGTVRVLQPGDYDDYIAAVAAAQAGMLQSSILTTLHLPLVFD